MVILRALSGSFASFCGVRRFYRRKRLVNRHLTCHDLGKLNLHDFNNRDRECVVEISHLGQIELL